MRARKRQTGSVLVEALLVISTMALCLMGTMYLRQHHLGKLQAMRFSRVTSLAYAMNGCRGTPAQEAARFVTLAERGTVGRPDLVKKEEDTSKSFTDFFGGDGSAKMEGTPQQAWNETKNTHSMLSMPYAETRSENTTRVSARESGRRQTVLARGVRMKSAVLCTEPIVDRDYLQIIPRLIGMIDLGEILN